MSRGFYRVRPNGILRIKAGRMKTRTRERLVLEPELEEIGGNLNSLDRLAMAPGFSLDSAPVQVGTAIRPPALR